jgi:LysR family transcriptional regulator, transcriptional activator of nhaA
MEWLNYHHLLYFWTVAKEGTIARAGEKLHLAQPTLSRQLAQLQDALGQKLFVRSGRLLELTEVGQLVFEYADEIFPVGQELMEVLRGRPRARPARFSVGISDVIPKLIAFRLLEPVLKMDIPVELICHEDKPDGLLLKLSSHAVDMVLTDTPLTNSIYKTRAFSHPLGSCGVTFFAAPVLARTIRREFPKSLDGTPFLLPLAPLALRRGLDEWFSRHGVRPRMVAEFQDSALLKVFGQAGRGVFAGPSVIEREIRRQYGVAIVGRTEEVTERYYAVSLERKVRHPAVLALSDAAREKLF